MSNVSISPNMNLVIPTVSVDSGPDWANNINASLAIIDQHNHSAGSGVQINPSGININSSLSMNTNPLINTQSVVFSPQLSLATLDAIYVSGVDLYYNDGSGNVIRITSGGSVTGSSGTITGLPSGTASASYQSGSGTFQFQSATNTPANISGASILIAEQVASPNAITVQSPSALAAAYTITLPAATPGSTSFMTMDASGNLGVSISTSGGITGTMLAALTITASNIANNTITTNQISLSAGITGTQIQNQTITATQLANNINLPGNHVSENGNFLVVSGSNPSTNSLAVLRATISSAGAVLAGEGINSIAISGGNTFTITFTFTFSDTPVAVACPSGSGSANFIIVGVIGGNSIQVQTYDHTGAGTFAGFNLIVMGQRS